MINDEFIFVGGPANGVKYCTAGHQVYIINTFNAKCIPGESTGFRPQDYTPSIPYYMPEKHLYHLENINGVKFYRYENDTITDSLCKLVTNYKPKKKKL